LPPLFEFDERGQAPLPDLFFFNLFYLVIKLWAMGLFAGLYVVLEEFDDVFGGGAGEEDFGDALLFEFGEVFLGDDAAYQDQNVVHSFFTEQLNDPGTERVVGAT